MDATVRFGMSKADLRRLLAAHRKDKKSQKATSSWDRKAEPETDIRYLRRI